MVILAGSALITGSAPTGRCGELVRHEPDDPPPGSSRRKREEHFPPWALQFAEPDPVIRPTGLQKS